MRLFKIGEYDYSDLPEVNRKLKYTEDFFKHLVKYTQEADLVTKHDDGAVLGSVTNLKVVDGWLCGDIPDDVNLKDKGLSPSFDYVSYDNNGVIHGGYLEHICLTDTPRNGRLLNSICLYNSNDKNNINNNEVGNMGETGEYFQNRVKELERERAVLQNKVDVLSKDNDSLKEKIVEYKKIEKEYEENKEKYEKSQANAEQWVKYETEQKGRIVKELAKDDKDYEEFLNKQSLSDLQTLRKKNVTNPRGVGNAGGQNHDTDDNKDSIEKYKERLESFKGYI